MYRLALTAAAALAATAGCAIPTPTAAPPASSTAPAPAPTVTVTAPAPTPDRDAGAYLDPDADLDTGEIALTLAWSDMSPTDRAQVCDAYHTSPTLAWSIVADSAGDLLTEATFHRFFSREC